ncbi:MAG: copper homeostasis protein CutC, partial [Hungatella sp.]
MDENRRSYHKRQNICIKPVPAGGRKRSGERDMVEICCGSYEDALAAWNGGAERIELNSALYLGGLTPTVGSLCLTKANTGLKVISMVRPRG